MVVKPNNNILKQAINDIVIHCKTDYYGITGLDVTGPDLLLKYFSLSEINSFELYNTMHKISRNNICIIDSYNEYREEQQKYSNNEHYSVLWNNRNIYN